MKNLLKITIVIFCCLQSTIFADCNSNDWATEIIEYTPGKNIIPAGYTNANAALGPAAKFTYADEPMTNMTSVTVINAAWLKDQVVSVGTDGKLILKMGRQIENLDEPEHPFGIDLLVFGNSFFSYDYGEGLPETNSWLDIAAEPAEIWVSTDATNWFLATNCFADALLPTQSIDLNDEPADYLFPPNPALLTNDWLDETWSYSNTVSAYAGSAGGAPVDLSQLETADGQATNLSYANFVKIENSSSDYAAEIDAVAAVADLPEGSCFFSCLLIVLLKWTKWTKWTKS